MCSVNCICVSELCYYIFFFFVCYGHHRGLHVLTRSFPTRRSSDLRRDRRILRNRQRAHRQDAGEHQDDRHHPRENRAVDEEVDHAAYFFSADLASDLACAGAVSAAASLPRSTGCTSAPGFTCCRPSTISLSPALTPSVTSH